MTNVFSGACSSNQHDSAASKRRLSKFQGVFLKMIVQYILPAHALENGIDQILEWVPNENMPRLLCIFVWVQFLAGFDVSVLEIANWTPCSVRGMSPWPILWITSLTRSLCSLICFPRCSFVSDRNSIVFFCFPSWILSNPVSASRTGTWNLWDRSCVA